MNETKEGLFKKEFDNRIIDEAMKDRLLKEALASNKTYHIQLMGKTFMIKEELKSCGFYWHSDRKVWLCDNVLEFTKRIIENNIANGTWKDVKIMVTEEKDKMDESIKGFQREINKEKTETVKSEMIKGLKKKYSDMKTDKLFEDFMFGCISMGTIITPEIQCMKKELMKRLNIKIGRKR